MGLTFKEIGEQMVTSSQAAHRRISRILKAAREKLLEEAAAYQMLEDERLDSALKAIWPKVITGDYKAINALIKIMERRARLLGLDGPIKIAPTDPTRENSQDAEPTVAVILGKLTALVEGEEEDEMGGRKVDAIGV